MFLSAFIINRFSFSKNYTLVEAAARVDAHNGLLAITFSYTSAEIEDIHHSHCCRGCAMAVLVLTSLWAGPWPPAVAAPDCGCVAFRLDDIQDWR
jgi:hypothetical protein